MPENRHLVQIPKSRGGRMEQTQKMGECCSCWKILPVKPKPETPLPQGTPAFMRQVLREEAEQYLVVEHQNGNGRKCPGSNQVPIKIV